MWKRFKANQREEAYSIKMLPGDGIARRIVVMKNPPIEKDQMLELVYMDNHGFTGRDPSGIMYACRWDEATAYEKRHEC